MGIETHENELHSRPEMTDLVLTREIMEAQRRLEIRRRELGIDPAVPAPAPALPRPSVSRRGRPQRDLVAVAMEAAEAEQEEARKEGRLTFYTRVLAQATLPHSRPVTNEFIRRNGHLTLSFVTESAIGLPYGTYPRLAFAWIATEANYTKNPRLSLGNRLSDWFRQVEVIPTGGRWGTIRSVREQMIRLFRCTISWSYDNAQQGSASIGGRLSEDYSMWWKTAEDEDLFDSYVVLTPRFFTEICKYGFPVRKYALKLLRRSPLALDFYTWLCHRYFYLYEPKLISWELLQAQFGADFKELKHFRYKALKALQAVHAVYPEAKFAEGKGGILLYPSPTHVPRKQIDTGQ